MNCRQALIARRDAASTLDFQVLQKLSNVIGREILDFQLVDRLAKTAGGKRQEQTQRIAVALLRVPGEVPLSHEVLQQEASHPRAEQGCVGHGCPPLSA